MRSRQLSLCALLTALAVVLMVLAGAIGIGTFAGPVLAMVVLLPILEEYGAKAAVTAYVSTTLLGILLIPEIELALLYLGFGWYPILRPRIARVPSRLLRVISRITICTAIILLLYGAVLRFLGLTTDLIQASPLFNFVLAVLGNITFLMLDKALARLTMLWHNKLRRQFLR